MIWIVGAGSFLLGASLGAAVFRRSIKISFGSGFAIEIWTVRELSQVLALMNTKASELRKFGKDVQ